MFIMTALTQLEIHIQKIMPCVDDFDKVLLASTKKILSSRQSIISSGERIMRFWQESDFNSTCKLLIPRAFPKYKGYSEKQLERCSQSIELNVRKDLNTAIQAGDLALVNKTKKEIQILRYDITSANKALADSVLNIREVVHRVEAYIDARLGAHGTAFTREIINEVKALNLLKKASQKIKRIIADLTANSITLDSSSNDARNFCLSRLAKGSSPNQLRVGRERAEVIKLSNNSLISQKAVLSENDSHKTIQFSPDTVIYEVENTHYPTPEKYK
jgi:hypothetical protein